MHRRRGAFLGLLLGVAASAGYAQQPPITLTRTGSGFEAPTDIQNASDGSNRIFVVQQNGLIRILRQGAPLEPPFLDIRNKTRAGGERGLLGLAFPPGFASKQYFYVNYTDLNGDTVISRYRVTANPNVADAQSEEILLRIDQPFANHNGGQLRFGPDGYLYVGMGDGGGSGDPFGNAQNRQAALGKILRFDSESDTSRLRPAPGNPSQNNPAMLAEVWALGLRNPWRFSFDRANGDLWIADVGQSTFEEVNYQPASSSGGENYGWNRMEGKHCFREDCSQDGLVLPVAEYGRADGCSVTGGFVYRGSRSPAIRGTYFYGDYCSGKIWGIRPQGNSWSNQLLLDTAFNITTFGEDEAGEVYVADAARGEIHQILSETTAPAGPSFSAASVVNAASGVQGITAGSAASIYGSGFRVDEGVTSAQSTPLPSLLAGVTVMVNDVPAPLYAVANVNGQEQINFQAPFEVAGNQAANVSVVRDGVAGAPVSVPVLPVQPGVFTGETPGNALVVHHADNTLVTIQKPLVPGEFAYFYATGLGLVVNVPATGSAAPVAPLSPVIVPPSVTIGGVPTDVLFAGLAPTLAGVYQVNIRVPAGVPVGSANLVISTGAVASPPLRTEVQ